MSAIDPYVLPPGGTVTETYDAMVADLNERDGENFDLASGKNFDSFVYARAYTIAMARHAVQRAYDNANPLLAYETLPLLEREYQLVPGPNDTITDRRNALAARMLLPLGAGRTNVTNALTTLLGSDFKYYRTTKNTERVNYPATGGASPGNFVDPRTVIKRFTVFGNISVGLGSPQWAELIPIEDDTPMPVIGDRYVVDPETLGLTESVIVLDADQAGETGKRINATFTKPHSNGRVLTTQRYPYWTSNQRHSLVIVTRACAENADKRRQINELMRRIARGVSRWDIVPDLDGSHTAPFTAGDTVLGRVEYAHAGASIAYP